MKTNTSYTQNRSNLNNTVAHELPGIPASSSSSSIKTDFAGINLGDSLTTAPSGDSKQYQPSHQPSPYSLNTVSLEGVSDPIDFNKEECVVGKCSIIEMLSQQYEKKPLSLLIRYTSSFTGKDNQLHQSQQFINPQHFAEWVTIEIASPSGRGIIDPTNRQNIDRVYFYLLDPTQTTANRDNDSDNAQVKTLCAFYLKSKQPNLSSEQNNQIAMNDNVQLESICSIIEAAVGKESEDIEVALTKLLFVGLSIKEGVGYQKRPIMGERIIQQTLDNVGEMKNEVLANLFLLCQGVDDPKLLDARSKDSRLKPVEERFTH